MRSFFACCLGLPIALFAAGPAEANVCAHDTVPAASLLFPFAVFDYNHPWSGETTIITITNMSAEAQVVHVTLWTDFGLAMMDFNILLTGYDVQRFNLRALLHVGQLPVTVSEVHTEDEGISQNGPVSEINPFYSGPLPPYPPDPEPTAALGDRCDPDEPGYPGRYVTPIPPSILELFRSWLSASQTVDRYHDNCFGDPFVPQPLPHWIERSHDSPTHLYLTADVVETCNRLFPSDPSYWSDEARTDNVLTGDAIWISSETATAAPAVHLEADADLGRVATTDDRGRPISFHYRYSTLAGESSDLREPLPTSWALRYLNNESLPASTDFLVWKGSTFAETPVDLLLDPVDLSPDSLVAQNCLPYTYFAWDEDENVLTLPWAPLPPGGDEFVNNYLPLATQRVPASQFALVDDRGWLLFAWPHSNANCETCPVWDRYQTWMGSIQRAWQHHAAYLPGVVAANTNCYSDQVLPDLGIDYDYVDEDGYRELAAGLKLSPGSPAPAAAPSPRR